MRYTREMNQKSIIIADLIAQLKYTLISAEQAAHQAHLSAIDEQSKAETQYDTLAIEASYLAEGHSKRIAQFKQELNILTNMPVRAFTSADAIAISALVTLIDQHDQTSWVLLTPCSGGLVHTFDNKKCQTVTPQSPLGHALIGKYCFDEITVLVGDKTLNFEIIAVN